MLFNTRAATLIIIVCLAATIHAQEAPENYNNPILPGYHPDPSICRVGEDYYLVNSTFEWFPGLPVYHSKDLVNWELIGYGIDRPLQLEFPEGLGDSRGVFAPTIRYHAGIYYIINTCVGCDGNFYITTTDPAGPWSDPVWLHSPGIDPSLFWDDDGRCYYVGHANISGVQDWPDKQGAWMQELDLEQQKLVGDRVQLTHGHASNAVWTEGPHLYKIDGVYILLVAEGGTSYHHAVTFFNSDSLWGPYISNQSNPALTHRHLGKNYPIHSVGHADLVETQNGQWWSVMLAKRQVDGYSLLARETFLTPVEFEMQETGFLTAVYNRGVGRLLMEQKRPDLPWTPVDPVPVRDELESGKLELHWNFLRTPYEKWYELQDGILQIQVRPQVVDKFENPSLIARRIEHHKFKTATKLVFNPKKENERAGLIIYRRSANHYQLLKEKNHLVLIKTGEGKKEELARIPYDQNEVVLYAEADGLDIQFKYGPNMEDLKSIGSMQNMNVVSDELAGGFNGSYVGMYATSNGIKSKALANFDWFEYKGVHPEDQ